ncbi:MAG: TRAP transporter substrate-binding protein DctP [Verrucomicrobia bacterium]|nr:TRAP transporter substrate-binding protein DctP [Verrucomicrobiota bacterium]
MPISRSTRREFLAAGLGLGLGGAWAWINVAQGASSPARVRLGTLAPKGSSYYKHLQVMGERWREISQGAMLLTIYPDGTMGSEADMVRRMRLGQLHAGLLTGVGLAEIEPAVTGLQHLPMMFRSLEELDHIGERLQPLLERRIEEKGFIVLFWCDTGWLRFFSKQPVITPQDLKQTKLFVWAGSAAEVDIYRSVGCNPVPLETLDILPSLQTGLINAVPLPPTIALAGQVDSVAPHMLDLAWAPLVGAGVVHRKTWEAVPPEQRKALRAAAVETGRLIKADGRRESVESIEAMRKRGLKVHPLPAEAEVEWRREVEAIYPRIRGTIVPADIFDEVVKALTAYRAAPGQPRK